MRRGGGGGFAAGLKLGADAVAKDGGRELLGAQALGLALANKLLQFVGAKGFFGVDSDVNLHRVDGLRLVAGWATVKQKFAHWVIFSCVGLVLGYFSGMTNNELIAERERMGLTQEEMATRLNGTSVHTYRKWEQGQRRVPAWVPAALVPKEMDLGGLSFEELCQLDELARKRGTTLRDLVADILRKGIKAGISLVVLAVLGYHLTHPSDMNARRIGRRRDSAEAVEVMGEA